MTPNFRWCAVGTEGGCGASPEAGDEEGGRRSFVGGSPLS